MQHATCNLDFDSLPTLPRRQAGGQAGAQSTVKPATLSADRQAATCNLKP